MIVPAAQSSITVLALQTDKLKYIYIFIISITIPIMDNVERLEGRQHSSFFLFCASGTIIDNIISMTGDTEDMIVPDIMNYVFCTPSKIP